jgi:hypothetical protein
MIQAAAEIEDLPPKPNTNAAAPGAGDLRR